MSKRWPRSDFPELSHSRFFMLSGLIDGSEKTRFEICKTIGWRTSAPNFFRLINLMIRSGLVEKSAVTLECDESNVRFLITDAGRQAWQESLDFYLFAAERFGNAAKPAETIRVVRRRPIAMRKRLTHRMLSPAEERRLFQGCSAAVRRLVIASRELSGLSLEEITALNVGEFDVRTGEIVHGNCRLPVSDDLEREIRDAIGNRKAGPLFCNRRGGRWSVNSAGTAFMRARRKAGISADVVLRGAVYRRAS